MSYQPGLPMVPGVPSQPTQRWPDALCASPSHTDNVTWHMLQQGYANNYGPQPVLNRGLRGVAIPEMLMVNGIGGPATYLSYNVNLAPATLSRQFRGRFCRA